MWPFLLLLQCCLVAVRGQSSGWAGAALDAKQPVRELRGTEIIGGGMLSWTCHRLDLCLWLRFRGSAAERCGAGALEGWSAGALYLLQRETRT
jgi:hypothetical protein